MTKQHNASLVRLVQCLQDGQYHDGTLLGNELGMTRSAVWKAIRKLTGLGVNIHSLKGKGYAMQEPFILLDAAEIKAALDVPCTLSVFESIESTNTYLRNLKPSTHPVICLAEQQTAGRGRLGRDWYSPFGENIYLSCAYPFQKDLTHLAGLSLVVGVSIIKALTGIVSNLKVKWPNDVFWFDKKLAGSLIEVQAESHGACHAIIGIGMNVNMQKAKSRAITQPWASLSVIAQHYQDRNQIAVKLLKQLLADLAVFSQQGFKAFQADWNQYDYLLNRTVTLAGNAEKISGVVQGISEQGHLVLRLPHGELRVFSSGDTSLVK